MIFYQGKSDYHTENVGPAHGLQLIHGSRFNMGAFIVVQLLHGICIFILHRVSSYTGLSILHFLPIGSKDFMECLPRSPGGRYDGYRIRQPEELDAEDNIVLGFFRGYFSSQ